MTSKESQQKMVRMTCLLTPPAFARLQEFSERAKVARSNVFAALILGLSDDALAVAIATGSTQMKNKKTVLKELKLKLTGIDGDKLARVMAIIDEAEKGK